MRSSVWLAGITASFLAVGLAAVPAARAGASTQASGNTSASTLYVYIGEAGCSDTGPGTEAEPFCTIQAAANAVQAGQTVEVRSADLGVISQAVTISSKGTAADPIHFVWEEPPGQTFLYSGPQEDHPIVKFDGAQYVTFSSFYIASDQIGDDGIDVDDSSNITLDNVTITAQEPPSSGISIDGTSSDVTVERSTVVGLDPAAVLVAAGASGVVLTTDFIRENEGLGVELDGAANSVVTGDTVYVGCAKNTNDAGNGVTLADGSSGTVENNILEALAGTKCPTPNAMLDVDQASAAGVTTGYNAMFVADGGADYSWAGTAYSTVQGFQQAVPGQGTNDITLSAGVTAAPPEGSGAIDSANCSAPDELSTDILGLPRVRDPLATEASLANGTCYADRGAYERQDSLTVRATFAPDSSPAFSAGTVPFSYELEVISGTTSPWGEPVSYTVNFGDGSALVTATPGTAVPHVYTTPGQYTVTVTATDTSGSFEQEAYTADAMPDAPATASLTATPDIDSGEILPDAAGFRASVANPSWQMGSAEIAYGDGSTSGNAGPASSSPNWQWQHVYAKPGTYTATVTVTDLLGRTSTAKATVTVGDELQTASPQADYAHSVAAHGTVKIPLGVLDEGAQARGALITVDVSDNAKAGSVIIYPNGTARPDLATVQFQAGKPAENSALATGGAVDFYNNSSGPIYLTIDTFGVEDMQTTEGGALGFTYAPVTPAQVLPRTELAPEHKTVVNVTGLEGVPASAEAVVLDVTEYDAAAPGQMLTYGEHEGTMYEDEDGYWAKGQQVTGLATVDVDGGRAILVNQSKGNAYFTADVVGYYLYPAPSAGAVFLPAAPDRLLKVTVAGKHWVKVAVAGKDGVPAASVSGAATAALVTLTAANATTNASFTAWADGTSRPGGIISLSYTKGQTAATAAIVQVGKDGDIDLYNGGTEPVLAVLDLDGSFYAY
jgi:PKD repeat protein